MPSFDDLFGELRSLMQRDRSPSSVSLLEVLEPAYALDPARYTDEWLPYPSSQELPLFFARDLDGVARRAALLPEGAPFTLSIDDRTFDFEEMAEAPQTARLTGITISHKTRMSFSRFKNIARSPYLGGLVRLDIGGNILRDDAMIALAKAASIHRLEYLRLYHNAIGPEGAKALAQSPKMSELRYLDISVNAILSEGFAALGASPYLGKLETLNAGHNKIKRAGAEDFAKTTTLVSLTSLTLTQNAIGNHGALALANCVALSNLRTLGIGRNRIDDKSMEYIRNSDHLTELVNIHVM